MYLTFNLVVLDVCHHGFETDLIFDGHTWLRPFQQRQDVLDVCAL